IVEVRRLVKQSPVVDQVDLDVHPTSVRELHGLPKAPQQSPTLSLVGEGTGANMGHVESSGPERIDLLWGNERPSQSWIIRSSAAATRHRSRERRNELIASDRKGHEVGRRGRRNWSGRRNGGERRNRIKGVLARRDGRNQ